MFLSSQLLLGSDKKSQSLQLLTGFSVFLHSYIISETLSYKRVVIWIDVVERVGVLVDFIIVFHEVRCCLTDAQHHRCLFLYIHNCCFVGDF